jgi:hypothetical protein
MEDMVFDVLGIRTWSMADERVVEKQVPKI